MKNNHESSIEGIHTGFLHFNYKDWTIQEHLRDSVGLVPDHHDKANIAVKQVT